MSFLKNTEKKLERKTFIKKQVNDHKGVVEAT